MKNLDLSSDLKENTFNFTEKFIGHSKVVSQLKSVINSENIPSTYLFAGTKGIGKSKVASAFAKGLLCSSKDSEVISSTTSFGCDECPSCQAFNSLSHPDLTYVSCDDPKWNIAAFRNLLADLSFKPFLDNGRVIIIDHAENLSLQSANLLLKAIEEPQHKTYFIFISSASYRLPVTVRSRCQVYLFNPLNAEELNSIIEPSLDTKLRGEILEVSCGVPSIVLRISNNIELWNEVKNVMREVRKGNHDIVYSFLKKFSKKNSKKDGDNGLSLTFLLLRSLGLLAMRRAKKPSEKYRWSQLITNVIEAEHLVNVRHLPIEQVLSVALLTVSPRIKARQFNEFIWN